LLLFISKFQIILRQTDSKFFKGLNSTILSLEVSLLVPKSWLPNEGCFS